MSVAMGSSGLKRLLDLALPEQQLGAEDHVSAWDATTGTFDPGFPAAMNDLQFFITPMIADVDGTGTASVVQSSAVYDTRAYHLGGAPAVGFPKQTAGWGTQTAAIGDVLGAGTVQVAEPTREGNLFLWTTSGSACQPREWPKFQHDEHNSGDYATDATPPGALRGVHLDGGTLTVTASGDNGWCAGTGSAYVLTVGGVQHTLKASPAGAGAVQVLDVSGLIHGHSKWTISERDAAGNLSFPVGPGSTRTGGAIDTTIPLSWPSLGGPELPPPPATSTPVLLAALVLGSAVVRRRRRAVA